MHKKIIGPSLLSADFLNLTPQLNALNSIEDIWLHLDIMDGHFVPNLTFGPVLIRSIQDFVKIPMDAHFMVSNPDFHAELWRNIKLHNFTFHLEAVSDPLQAFKKYKKIFPNVGISVRPHTPIDKLSDSLLEVIDLILIMSVEPGFGGQSFMPEVLSKVSSLASRRQSKGYHYQLQIDGGISDQTINQASQAGIDNFVAGSFIFNHPSNNIQMAIEALRKSL